MEDKLNDFENNKFDWNQDWTKMPGFCFLFGIIIGMLAGVLITSALLTP